MFFVSGKFDVCVHKVYDCMKIFQIIATSGDERVINISGPQSWSIFCQIFNLNSFHHGSAMKLVIGDPTVNQMMLPAGIYTAFSNSKCKNTYFTKSIGMEGKGDMTSNGTMHSSGFMVNPCFR